MTSSDAERRAARLAAHRHVGVADVEVGRLARGERHRGRRHGGEGVGPLADHRGGQGGARRAEQLQPGIAAEDAGGAGRALQGDGDLDGPGGTAAPGDRPDQVGRRAPGRARRWSDERRSRSSSAVVRRPGVVVEPAVVDVVVVEDADEHAARRHPDRPAGDRPRHRRRARGRLPRPPGRSGSEPLDRGAAGPGSGAAQEEKSSGRMESRKFRNSPTSSSGLAISSSSSASLVVLLVRPPA